MRAVLRLLSVAGPGTLPGVRFLVVAAALAVALATALFADAGVAAGTFRLTSPAFAAGGMIPARHTCDGAGAVVPLRWSGTPAGTRSLALIVDDPDAPIGTFLHRIAWGITGTATSLTARAPVEGANGTGRVGWLGPCPPSGTHRYVFRLYALESTLPLRSGADLAAFEAALRGRTLGVAKLVGRYRR
jgi:Raf kinase inhibitor-like YbhB/YbcL family protein